MKTFGQLFKKYRLRAEFATLTEFADAFAQKGYFYDLSIYSHWQNGARVPRKRELILSIIEVFIDRGAVVSAKQANEILESTGHGYLTNKENQKILVTLRVKYKLAWGKGSDSWGGSPAV